jgi:endonuclease/exonuclease/phosphatase family metal-dependent hydrolase
MIIRLILILFALNIQIYSQSTALLESGNTGRNRAASNSIRWRGGRDLEKLIEFFRNHKQIGGADIIGLQEVDRNRKRTGNINTAKKIAESLGMNYVWAAPPSKPGDEEETGVAILSHFEISDTERIVLPNPGPGGRQRAAVGCTVNGPRKLRVYSVHAETRVPMLKKMEQLRAVVNSLNLHPLRDSGVVLGDFNTIKGKDVDAAKELFTSTGFSTPIPHNLSTWKTFIIDLKLDWIWLRGLESLEWGIAKDIGLSDHWPLWVTIKS